MHANFWVTVYICIKMVLPYYIGSTSCTDFGDPENGFRTLQEDVTATGTNTVALFGCNRGFQLVGDKRLVCRQREWNGEWPRCTPALGQRFLFCFFLYTFHPFLGNNP